MADQYVAVTSGITLTTSAVVVLDVASTSAVRRMNLNEIGVSFNGTSSSATPVSVQVVRCSGTTASATSPALTQSATPLDSSAPSSSFTAYAPNSSAAWTGGTAPTVGVILRQWLVSPTSGIVVQFPLGQEPDGPATTNSGLGIQVTAPAAVGITSYLVWTE